MISKIKRLKKNLLNYFSSIKKARQPFGQLSNETESGILMTNFIHQYNISNVLEIGTWNGLGSTLTILNALKNNSKNFSFISIESDKIFHEQAIKNLKNENNIELKLGRLFEIHELPNVQELDLELFGLNKGDYEWYLQDLRRYKKIKNIYNELPLNFDFILFDGGEFSTYPEFIKLYTRTKFFALDDTEKYKQFEVLKFINTHLESFRLINSIRNFSIYQFLG